MSITDALNQAAKEIDPNAKQGATTVDALDALADALAGTDVDSGNTVSDAIKAVAGYIGKGGGTNDVFSGYGHIDAVPVPVSPIQHRSPFGSLIDVYEAVISEPQSWQGEYEDASIGYEDGITFSVNEQNELVFYGTGSERDVAKVKKTGDSYYYEQAEPTVGAFKYYVTKNLS